MARAKTCPLLTELNCAAVYCPVIPDEQRFRPLYYIGCSGAISCSFVSVLYYLHFLIFVFYFFPCGSERLHSSWWVEESLLKWLHQWVIAYNAKRKAGYSNGYTTSPFVLFITRYEDGVNGTTFVPPLSKSNKVTLIFTPRLSHVTALVTKRNTFDKLDVTELFSRACKLDWSTKNNVAAMT